MLIVADYFKTTCLNLNQLMLWTSILTQLEGWRNNDRLYWIQCSSLWTKNNPSWRLVCWKQYIKMLWICHTYYHVINELVCERAALGAINVIFQLIYLIYCWCNLSHSRDDNSIVHCVTDVNSLVHIYTDEDNGDLNAESIQYLNLHSFRGSHIEYKETNLTPDICFPKDVWSK